MSLLTLPGLLVASLFVDDLVSRNGFVVAGDDAGRHALSDARVQVGTDVVEPPARGLGPTPFRRLTSFQYTNVVRDLLRHDGSPADGFPPDLVGVSFNNDATVQSLSPLHLELYAMAASELAAEAAARVECPSSGCTSATKCARIAIGAMATKLWRRPVSESEVDRLMDFLKVADKLGGGPERGIELAFEAILLSPSFLFVIESRDGPVSDGARTLSGRELATRLALFLWGSVPDDELLRAAAAGRLVEQADIAAQVERMLNDPRRTALVEDFGAQWLSFGRIPLVEPFNSGWFERDLPANAAAEVRVFLESFIDRPEKTVYELVDSPSLPLNDRMAEHYGMRKVGSHEFTWVPRGDAPRTGILTMASTLAVTSNPQGTSPVKRGKWILDRLLCRPPSPPPPEVIADFIENAEHNRNINVREVLTQHQTPYCAKCHVEMDGLGFGLENFDEIGKWRDDWTPPRHFVPIDATAHDDEPGDHEGPPPGKMSVPIDATGKMLDGRTFDGPVELSRVIAEDPAYPGCVAEKMVTYALGRPLGPGDHRELDPLVRDWVAHGARFRDLIVRVATSRLFTHRDARPEPAP